MELNHNINIINSNFILEVGKDSYENENKMIKNNNFKKRKIFSISMVKNEEDIIESFVRYHCNIFDGMVIKDNCSSDNTLSILRKLEAEGKQIYILQDSSTEFSQSIKITELLYDVIDQFEPDFIIPIDADEFLVTSKNNGNPLNILNKLDSDKSYTVMWRNYIPHLDDDENQKFVPKRFTYARWDKEIQGKLIISKQTARNSHIKLAQGCHCLLKEDERFYPDKINELRIAHYPVRTINQFKSKVLVGWINALSRYDTNKPDCWHWEILYNNLKNKKYDISKEELIEIAKNYNYRRKLDLNPKSLPIDLSFCDSIDIKYTEYEEIQHLKNLLSNCEILAKEYGSLKEKYLKLIDKYDSKKKVRKWN